MTYTQIGIAMVIGAIAVDLWLLRTRLVARKGFWVAYAIVLFFQLLTNGVLTALHVFRYSDAVIVGGQPADDGPPPFFGEGRIVFQPFEDLLMGFSLCLLTMALWIYWGRRGVQRTPMSGPPIWRDPRWRRSGGTADGTRPAGAAGAHPGGPSDGEPTS
jgi:lycopene cyclase domain-containing protein